MSLRSIISRTVSNSLTKPRNRGMKLGTSFSKAKKAIRSASSQASSTSSPLPRSIATVGTVAVVAAAGCFASADAEPGAQQTKEDNIIPTGALRSRLQSDICHMTPGISEVLLDILDLLQENCDNYVSSMIKRVNELESNLQKYASTISLNLSDEEMSDAILSDPETQEIHRYRKEYKLACKKCNEMVEGLEKFLFSAQQFGVKTCIESCRREMDEVLNLLDSMEQKVLKYERKLSMTEKHFNSRKRRGAGGLNKNH